MNEMGSGCGINIVSWICLMIVLTLFMNNCMYGIIRIAPVEARIAEPYSFVGNKSGVNGNLLYSKDNIKYLFGDEDSAKKQNCEILSYSDGLKWNFFVLIIGWIPLPFFVIPTGKRYKKFYFRDNALVGVERSHYDATHLYGYLITDKSNGMEFGSDRKVDRITEELGDFIENKCQFEQ